ncbi:MAG: nucleotidyltransferase family protein [Bryobacterales bacterium]|nr:nucleotidyltransferase family protein [Bryobacterales bacterium]
MQAGPAIDVDAVQLAEVCHRFHVQRLAVFGSAARGEMRPDSDVDLLVEFRPEAEIGFIEYAGLMLDLSKLLGRKVDLVSKPALRPLLRDAILREARLLYAA